MENENKQMAWFPAPYLEKLDDDDDDEDDIDGTPERGNVHGCSFYRHLSYLHMLYVV